MQHEEDDPHTDPFGELADENNVFVKIESNFAEEEHATLEDTSCDFVAEAAIGQETSIGDIESEWVRTVLKLKI